MFKSTITALISFQLLLVNSIPPPSSSCSESIMIYTHNTTNCTNIVNDNIIGIYILCDEEDDICANMEDNGAFTFSSIKYKDRKGGSVFRDAKYEISFYESKMCKDKTHTKWVKHGDCIENGDYSVTFGKSSNLTPIFSICVVALLYIVLY